MGSRGRKGGTRSRGGGGNNGVGTDSRRSNGRHTGDTLHRTLKVVLDTGEATTLEEAQRLFAGYRLVLEIGRDVAGSPTLQAMVLTAVNTARRCFLGGVDVVGSVDMDLLVPWKRCRTLAEAVTDLQGRASMHAPARIHGLPRIIIGDGRLPIEGTKFAVSGTFDGWCGGVLPADDPRRLPERQECVPAGVLAGALAVGEVFQHVRGNPYAGRRDAGLSLWSPEPTVSWLDAGGRGQRLELLPAELWVIGLGHLGQAYLWTLGLLPYEDAGDVLLVLQDFDVLVEANDSTSLLTKRMMLGQMKTRAMARWADQRGFQTRLVERPFGPNFHIARDEPGAALCGVDNPRARAALEDVGFQRIIDAGLGAGPQEFLAFQIHAFPANRRTAHAVWDGVPSDDIAPAPTPANQPAYDALVRQGADPCGVTLLAGRTVGASFVGAATASMVIAEALRLAMGAHSYELVDGSLRSLERRQAIMTVTSDAPFNPGFTRAAPLEPH